MSPSRNDPAIVALSETGGALARRIQAVLRSGEVLAADLVVLATGYKGQ